MILIEYWREFGLTFLAWFMQRFFTVDISKLAYRNLKSRPVLPPGIDLTGQTFLIIGGSRGLGFGVARKLVQLGAERVIITSRTQEAASKAKEEIEASTGKASVVEAEVVELCDFANVQSFIKRIKEKTPRLDGLLLNAALCKMNFSDRQYTKDNWERMIQTNYISTVIIGISLHELLDKTSQTFGKLTYMTFVTSIAAWTSLGFFFESQRDQKRLLDALNERKWSVSHYDITKLMCVMATRELANALPLETARLRAKTTSITATADIESGSSDASMKSEKAVSGVVINVNQPGLSHTHIQDGNPAYFVKLQAKMERPIDYSAAAMVYTLVAAGSKSHGKVVGDLSIDPPPQSLLKSYGKQWQKEVWRETVDLLKGLVESADLKSCNLA